MQTLEPYTGKTEWIGLQIADLSATPVSEFDVQATLYSELKRHGFDVRGEVTVRGKQPIINGRRCQMRFDLVMYETGRATHIVEVKANPVKHKNGLNGTRQARRYQCFGVPVTFVYGLADAEQFVRDQIERRGNGIGIGEG